MRSKDSVVALKDLPQPELRLFGQTSGVTNIYGNGAVVVEASVGHGYFPSHRELVNRLGPEYQKLISSVEKSYQIRTTIAENVAAALDALPMHDLPIQPDIRDLRSRRNPINSAALPEVIAPSTLYTTEVTSPKRLPRKALLTAAVAAF